MENIIEIQTKEYKGYRIEIGRGKADPMNGERPFLYRIVPISER